MHHLWKESQELTFQLKDLLVIEKVNQKETCSVSLITFYNWNTVCVLTNLNSVKNNVLFCLFNPLALYC